MKNKLFVVMIMVGVFCAWMNVSAWAGAIAGADADAGASSVLIQDDHSRTKIDDTPEFYSPGPMPGVSLPAYISDHKDSADPSLRSAKDLIRFGNVFSKAALENLAAGGDVKVNFPIVKNRITKPDNVLADGQQWLMIVIEPPGPEDKFYMSAPVDARADDAETTSFQVIGKLGLKALANGDNVLLLTSEGFLRKMEAGGWSIGSYGGGAVTSDGGTTGGSGGMGLGIGESTVGPEHRPWVKGYSGHFARQLAVDVTNMKALKAPSEFQTGNHKSPIGR